MDCPKSSSPAQPTGFCRFRYSLVLQEFSFCYNIVILFVVASVIPCCVLS
uniref:Uncharacterized protein n=1 Tax=Arundo donax TaxID=35708 RepID=A0A0A9EMC2_ARUDO